MPNVYPTSVSATSDGQFTITIFGINELIAALHKLNPDIEKELKKEIKDAGNKVLQESKGHAAGLGHSPTKRRACASYLATPAQAPSSLPTQALATFAARAMAAPSARLLSASLRPSSRQPMRTSPSCSRESRAPFSAPAMR